MDDVHSHPIGPAVGVQEIDHGFTVRDQVCRSTSASGTVQPEPVERTHPRPGPHRITLTVAHHNAAPSKGTAVAHVFAIGREERSVWTVVVGL